VALGGVRGTRIEKSGMVSHGWKGKGREGKAREGEAGKDLLSSEEMLGTLVLDHWRKKL
jgi:hypothetical protein